GEVHGVHDRAQRGRPVGSLIRAGLTGVRGVGGRTAGTIAMTAAGGSGESGEAEEGEREGADPPAGGDDVHRDLRLSGSAVSIRWTGYRWPLTRMSSASQMETPHHPGCRSQAWT